MKREVTGGDCEFDLSLSGLCLHPILFNAQKTHGNENFITLMLVKPLVDILLCSVNIIIYGAKSSLG